MLGGDSAVARGRISDDFPTAGSSSADVRASTELFARRTSRASRVSCAKMLDPSGSRN